MAKEKDGRAKVWEIQTQLYDTYGQPYVDPDVLRARLDELRQTGEIIDYAMIVHNRCRYTQDEEDEAAEDIRKGKHRQPIKCGDQKPEHLHCPIKLKNGKTLSALAKWLSCDTITVPELWLIYVRDNKDGEKETFDDKCAYLCHERHPEKTPYRYDEVMASFDYEAMMKQYMAKMARKSKSKKSRAFQEEHVNKIANGEESIAQFIQQFGFATYEANKSKYDHAEQYYLQTSYQGVGFRLTYLITGESTIGKSPLAKMLACSLFPEISNPRDVFFCVGGAGSTLQSYRGQPVIIWDDWRANVFVSTFGRETVFNSLFQVHPDPTDFNIKYGQTVLRHTVNIVTSIEGVDDFAKSLAGEYTSKDGVRHKSEEQQVLQAYKRIWGLSEVTEDEITVMFNRGYYTNNAALEYYKQYQTALVVKNYTSRLANKYGTALYATMGKQMVPVFDEMYKEFAERETNKITDPELFDPADLPPVVSPEEILDRERLKHELDERLQWEYNRYLDAYHKRFGTITYADSYVEWLEKGQRTIWNDDAGGFVRENLDAEWDEFVGYGVPMTDAECQQMLADWGLTLRVKGGDTDGKEKNQDS